jgi:hypothetical protein
MRASQLGAIAFAGLVAGGCSIVPSGMFGRSQPAPEPLVAAPAGDVTAAPLPPPPGATLAPPSALTAADPALQADATGAATSAVEVGRADLLGAWTVSSAGDSCQLFMTLTTWSGGYRASTKGCGSEPLQKISAWNLEGQQVQLLDDSGATVGRLYPSSKTEFNGQTPGGGPVSFSR